MWEATACGHATSSERAIVVLGHTCHVDAGKMCLRWAALCIAAASVRLIRIHRAASALATLETSEKVPRSVCVSNGYLHAGPWTTWTEKGQTRAKRSIR